MTFPSVLVRKRAQQTSTELELGSLISVTLSTRLQVECFCKKEKKNCLPIDKTQDVLFREAITILCREELQTQTDIIAFSHFIKDSYAHSYIQQ